MLGWTLAGVTMVGLGGIGLGALVAPRIASAQYGIVVDDARALAFLRAMGVRDLSLGLVLAAVAMRSEAGTLGWAMLGLVPVALVDFALVMADRRTHPGAASRGAAAAPLLHGGGVLGLVAAGTALLLGV